MDLANSTRQVGMAGSGALAVLIGLFSSPHADAARLSPQILVGSEALANLRGKTVLLAGATGNNGRVVLRQLAVLGVHVRAMTRDPARASITSGLTRLARAQPDPQRPRPCEPREADLGRAAVSGDVLTRGAVGPCLARSCCARVVVPRSTCTRFRGHGSTGAVLA